jgi:hypothetical protein
MPENLFGPGWRVTRLARQACYISELTFLVIANAAILGSRRLGDMDRAGGGCSSWGPVCGGLFAGRLVVANQG